MDSYCSEQFETPFDYYLQWSWPEHIETALRRLMWIWFVELAEGTCYRDGDNRLSYVRRLMAACPNTPAAVLEHLIDVVDEGIQQRIAENPGTPWQGLTKLSFSQSPAVRACVADNSNCPLEVQRMLALDESVDVRYAMAENPYLASELLKLLAQDENGYVCHRAARTLNRQSVPSQQYRFSNRPERDRRRKIG